MKTIQLNLSKKLKIVSIRFSMSIDDTLLKWYASNQRPLPWRNSKVPYVIWISEIIMQQTRIDQGTSYFLRFIEKYPTVQELAKASEADVLLLWQGLGYYSRARNLHSTAKHIVNELNGRFPDNYNDMLKLKGVGEYTAAAIASFCFNEKVAAIDGNVYRVITRLFDIEKPIDKSEGKSEVKKLCTELLPNNKSDDFNQAMMDFGATICLPKNPHCNLCPLIHKCLSKKNNTVLNRPIKASRTKQRDRYFTYLVLTDNIKTLINKRTNNDIWKGLYEFPLIESENEISINEVKGHGTFISILKNHQVNQIKIIKSKQHILSHQKINSEFIIIQVQQIKETSYMPIKLSNLFNYAFPVLVSNFIESNLK